MIQFDLLTEAVKQQMQPASRVQHLAGMLQELVAYTPNDATLADLVLGWQMLARSQSADETPAIAHRREVYADLAAVATQLTHEQGNLTRTVNVWKAWTDAFRKSAEPHKVTMAKTLSRELLELQSHA